MDNRTLVKVSARENCIGFKTISRRKKSPRTFLVTRNMLIGPGVRPMWVV